jgi:MFS family permease
MQVDDVRVDYREQHEAHPSLLRNRDFMLLWSGFAVSTLGTSFSNLAMPILALAITGSPAQAGLIGAAKLAPYLIFSLPAGALLDRWNRKTVMVYCDFLRFFVLASIPIAFAFGWLTIIQLAIVAFCEGIGHVFFSVAQLAALPRVTPGKQLAQANALNEGASSVATVIGPGLSGSLISLARNNLFGAVLGYLFDSITYLVCGIALLFIRTPFQVERTASDQRSLRNEIVEGLKFLWRHRLLRALLILTTCVNFFQAPTYLTTIVLVQDVLRADAATLGLIFSLSGGGAVLGSIVAPWLKAKLRFGNIIVGSVVIWAIAALCLAMAAGAPMVVIGWVLINTLWPIYAVTLVSYRQAAVPDMLQGRVNSAFRTLSYGIEPLGVAIGGFLLDPLGARMVLQIIAAGIFVIAAAALLLKLHRAEGDTADAASDDMLSSNVEQLQNA